MKNKLLKILLFTICMMPIMAKAIDISSIKKEWDYRETFYHNDYYYDNFSDLNEEIISTDDSFIFINEGNILKIDKSTGQEKEIQLEEYYYDWKIIDDKIYVEQHYQDDSGKYIFQKKVIDYDLEILEEYNYKFSSNEDLRDTIFYNNNYYAVTSKRVENNQYINAFYIFDENLNLLKSKETEPSTSYFYTFYSSDDYLKVGKYENYATEYFIIDSNLNLTEIPESNSKSNNSYYGDKDSSSVTEEEYEKIGKILEKEREEDEYFHGDILKDQEGNFYVAVEHFYKYGSNKKAYREVRIYNEDYKEVFRKNIATSDERRFYNDCGDKEPVFFIELVDNYLLVANSTLDDTELYFMDKTGEIVKDISSDIVDKELVPYRIIPEEKGMLVINSLERVECDEGIEQPSSIKNNFSNNKTKSLKAAPPSRYAYQLVYYSYNYIVNSKTDGNGSVNSEKVQAKSGEEIKFTVTPNEGYVLEKVKVTDANGNVVIFKDYTFTMPSADVTIEATFIKEVKNPVTSTNSKIIFISVLTIFVFILSSYKMKKSLK